jgi:hypothetical protein
MSWQEWQRYDSLSEDEDDEADGRDGPDPDASKPEGGGKKAKRSSVGAKKREVKNAREKERSSRIAKQIDELRDVLTSCGVILPKGTKSSVLSEVATYIRLLQQQQLRSEVYVHALVTKQRSFSRFDEQIYINLLGLIGL